MINLKRGVLLAASLVMIGSSPSAAATMPDAWITTKAKMALLSADGVSATAVNVDTVDGHVTLHGTVATDAEKATAEKVVKGIDGVTQVRNLLSVVPESKQSAAELADDKLDDNVQAALDRDAYLDDSDIDVASVNNGTVLLEGKANTMSEKLRAIEVARAVPGVRKVQSQISGPDALTDAEVWHDTERPAERAGDTPKQSGASDAWITSAAKVRLIGNAETPALDINVDTRDGVVTLFGMVPTDAAKRAAEVEVKKVSGVKSIKNELRVVAEAKQEQVEAKDEQIKDNVVKRLDTAPLDDDDITVEVSAGAVRLSGSVDSQTERLRALTVARGAAGVRSVVDDLRIDQQASR